MDEILAPTVEDVKELTTPPFSPHLEGVRFPQDSNGRIYVTQEVADLFGYYLMTLDSDKGFPTLPTGLLHSLKAGLSILQGMIDGLNKARYNPKTVKAVEIPLFFPKNECCLQFGNVHHGSVILVNPNKVDHDDGIFVILVLDTWKGVYNTSTWLGGVETFCREYQI